MSKIKEILVAMGVLVAIVTLSVFMFTASSTLFTILAGVGAASVLLLYNEYRTAVDKVEAHKNDCVISYQSFRLFQKMKEDYKATHPQDKFFDP